MNINHILVDLPAPGYDEALDGKGEAGERPSSGCLPDHFWDISGIFWDIYLPAHRGETSELFHLFSQPLAWVRVLGRFNFLSTFRTGLSSPGLRK